MGKIEAATAEGAHAQGWLCDARDSIDAAFGQGYAAANPELVGAFIAACASEQLAVAVRDNVGGGLGEVGAGLQNVGSGLLAGGFGS